MRLRVPSVLLALVASAALISTASAQLPPGVNETLPIADSRRRTLVLVFDGRCCKGCAACLSRRGCHKSALLQRSPHRLRNYR